MIMSQKYLTSRELSFALLKRNKHSMRNALTHEQANLTRYIIHLDKGEN